MIVLDALAEIAAHLSLFLALLVASTVLSALISRRAIGRFFGGLVAYQVSFVVNVAVIAFFAILGRLDADRIIFFVLSQGFATWCVYYVYRIILADRVRIFAKLERLPMAQIAAASAVLTLGFSLINLALVPTDGGSRIQFMTANWYSYAKIPISIVMPLGWFIAIYLLDARRFALGGSLAAVLVLNSASSGSKAGFLLSVLTTGLFFRDLKGSRLNLKLGSLVTLGALLGGAAILVLRRLNVTAIDMGVRIVHYAEATIMVYLANDPTEACRGVSLGAAMHRGVARLFGDASATNIDTLFGFALSAVHYGGNSFTGPNASVSAYLLCNFPGVLSLIGGAVMLAYTFGIRAFYTEVVSKSDPVTVLLLPFVVSSLNAFAQDYNTGMSDLTTLTITTLAFLAVRSASAFTLNAAPRSQVR